MNEGKEENNRTRRLIVPMVAVMMCAVAIIGIGFSLSPTVENNGNTVEANEPLGIDLYTNITNPTPVESLVFSEGMIDYVTKKTVDGTSTPVLMYAWDAQEVELNNGDLWIGIEGYDSTKTYNITMNATEDVFGDVKFSLDGVIDGNWSDDIVTVTGANETTDGNVTYWKVTVTGYLDASSSNEGTTPEWMSKMPVEETEEIDISFEVSVNNA